MKKYNVLILTDHTNHSKENSLYPLVKVMLEHHLTNRIDIALRANTKNELFFKGMSNSKLFVSKTHGDFTFTKEGKYLSENLRYVELGDYDLVWLRIPPPLSGSFLNFIEQTFSNQIIINNPKGIHETGSKAFLINFQSFCPPIKICRSKQDIIEFKNQFPIVLKPFREYGGKGIIRIDNNEVWSGNKKIGIEEFIDQLDEKDISYLGVKFLKNVDKGDKRIIVVNGKIMGASLRLPAKGSWLCNVSMGGTSNIAEVDDHERLIVEAVNPTLSKMGIVMYGIDTLVGDNNQRVLSEINTTSIGGLPQIANLKKLPLIEEAIDLIWSYFLNEQ